MGLRATNDDHRGVRFPCRLRCDARVASLWAQQVFLASRDCIRRILGDADIANRTAGPATVRRGPLRKRCEAVDQQH